MALRLSRRSGHALAFALYGALAVASTWPLAARLGAGVPMGSEPEATVPLASTWALWWGGAGLTHPGSYWNAPIFFPAPDSFALSEPMPLLGLALAPVAWLGGGPAAAHGLAVLLALTLNGWLGFLLCRALRLRPSAALAGGALVLLLPFVHSQLGVLTLVPLGGILASLLAVLALARRPTQRRGLALGLGLAATYLLCGQNLIFVLLTVPLAALWLLARPRRPRALAVALAVAAITFALPVAPVVQAQLRAMRAHDFARPEARAAQGAAGVPSWLRAPAGMRASLPLVTGVEPEHRRALFPGALRLVLAGAGAAWAARRPGRRRRAAFLVTLAVAAGLLASLPRLRVGSFEPFDLVRWLPGVGQLRSIFRAAVLTQVAVAVLAAVGLHAAAGWVDARTRRRGGGSEVVAPRAGAVALAVLVALALVEFWPPRQALAEVPSRRDLAPLSSWIEAHARPGEPLVHLPFPQGPTPRDFEETARWMVLGTQHHRPLANGYSSFFPPSYIAIAQAMAGFPDARSLDAVRSLGGRTVIARRSWRLARHLSPPESGWLLALGLPTLDLEIWVASEASARVVPAGMPGSPYGR